MLMDGCSKEPLDESILIEKDRLMYEPNSDEPYSGEVFTNYSTGEKEYQGRYENGLLIEYSYINKDGSVKEPVNMETLIDSSGLLYGVSRQKPYTGDVFELNKNGGKKYLVQSKGVDKTNFGLICIPMDRRREKELSLMEKKMGYGLFGITMDKRRK